MKMYYPLQISASIVLYKNDPAEVLAAVASLTSSSLQVGLMAIDNSPTEELREAVESLGAEYHFIGSNVGFGAGHNIALRAYMGRSEYHLILNPDVHFDPQILTPLYDFMQANRNVGLVMPRVLYPDGSEQRLCKLLPRPIDLIVRRFGGPLGKLFQSGADRYLLKGVRMDQPGFVPCVSGCFMLVRTETLVRIGLFDERYFMYMEDVDLCRRVAEIADTFFFPGVAIIHEYAKGSYRSKRLLKYHIQSAWRYFEKWGWFVDQTRDRLNERMLARLESEFIQNSA
jgi:GT2 family glycosyltransferase